MAHTRRTNGERMRRTALEALTDPANPEQGIFNFYSLDFFSSRFSIFVIFQMCGIGATPPHQTTDTPPQSPCSAPLRPRPHPYHHRHNRPHTNLTQFSFPHSRWVPSLVRPLLARTGASHRHLQPISRTGCSGLVLGGVAAVLRSTPTVGLFAAGTGLNCFALGSTCYGMGPGML